MTRKKRKTKANSSLFSTSNIVIVGGLVAVLIVGILIVTRQDEADTNANNTNDTNEDVPPASVQETVQMPHLHGISFSADGEQLIVPAHIGLVVFENNLWSIPDIPGHDYMGYSGVDDGFFSSGHPSVESGLINPLGLIKSTDGGHSITNIGFEGETDFHYMAVGYENHTIYVLNPQTNPTLSAGVHYSLDEGQTWQPSELAGLEGSLLQIAVHPSDSATVVISTDVGLFLSTDFGASFTRIGNISGVTAVSFHPNGGSILFGNTGLYMYNLANQQTETLSIPLLAANDFIAFIAVSPVNEDIAFATFGKNIYLTRDNGQNWVQIAREGLGING